MDQYHWLGRDTAYLDHVSIATSGEIVVGCYGGAHDDGAQRNEDGVLVWSRRPGDWEFALLLDAHTSSDSAALVLDTVSQHQEHIVALLDQQDAAMLRELEHYVITLFTAHDFRARCRTLRGETACLLCARRGRFLWWLSIGDCALYLMHPELAALGQIALNQRNFFEWIGRVNSFDLPVPCYSSGVRELRHGQHTVLLATDGWLQDVALPFVTPQGVYDWFNPEHITSQETLVSRISAALHQVSTAPRARRDSTTLVAWLHECSVDGARPTS
jgi:hypothetical protein